jgi:hypothetical protein
MGAGKYRSAPALRGDGEEHKAATGGATARVTSRATPSSW